MKTMCPKTTQAASNPFPNSDSNKRYYTYEYYLRRIYGRKAARIPLDAGLSCPNIDSGGGCIYCSGRGSGDCVPEGMSLREQYDEGRRRLSGKWDTDLCIAYLQAHTNTYAPVSRLRKIYDEILSFPALGGFSIATRADCLPADVLDLLAGVSRKTRLTVELGLQSSNDATAELIRRGHSFESFINGYAALRRAVPGCSVCIHIILGLPGENEEKMMRTVRDTAGLKPDLVKIHLLHVIKDTPLADMYLRGEYEPLDEEQYVRLAAEAITLLPPDTVICRLTGDATEQSLLAPEWSRRKTCVINDIDKYLYSRGLYQGCAYETGGQK